MLVTLFLYLSHRKVGESPGANKPKTQYSEDLDMQKELLELLNMTIEEFGQTCYTKIYEDPCDTDMEECYGKIYMKVVEVIQEKLAAKFELMEEGDTCPGCWVSENCANIMKVITGKSCLDANDGMFVMV